LPALFNTDLVTTPTPPGFVLTDTARQ
jgi:hypothetical protein